MTGEATAELRSEDAATRVVVHVENVGKQEGDGAPVQCGTVAVKKPGEYWACVRCGSLHNEERIAQYCCATSFPCNCGGRYAKPYTACPDCRRKRASEIYAKLKTREWDGEEPLTFRDGDCYFWDPGELNEYINDALPWTRLEDLHVVFCRKQGAQYFSVYEHLENDLPEDGDVPRDPREIEKTVNDWLQALGTLSYHPANERPTEEWLREGLEGPIVGQYEKCHNFNPDDVCDSTDCPWHDECIPKQKAEAAENTQEKT